MSAMCVGWERGDMCVTYLPFLLQEEQPKKARNLLGHGVLFFPQSLCALLFLFLVMFTTTKCCVHLRDWGLLLVSLISNLSTRNV